MDVYKTELPLVVPVLVFVLPPLRPVHVSVPPTPWINKQSFNNQMLEMDLEGRSHVLQDVQDAARTRRIPDERKSNTKHSILTEGVTLKKGSGRSESKV